MGYEADRFQKYDVYLAGYSALYGRDLGLSPKQTANDFKSLLLQETGGNPEKDWNNDPFTMFNKGDEDGKDAVGLGVGQIAELRNGSNNGVLSIYYGIRFVNDVKVPIAKGHNMYGNMNAPFDVKVLAAYNGNTRKWGDHFQYEIYGWRVHSRAYNPSITMPDSYRATFSPSRGY